MTSRLAGLFEIGQAVWLDYIRRDILGDELKRMIRDDALAGMTTNPTIFAGAIGKTALYDDAIRAAGSATAEEIFESIAVADVRAACDLFRPVWEEADGGDGFVSIEVNPNLARDAAGTIREAVRLHEAVDRPNCMIKIPGTREGLHAVEETLAAGIPVNITLLFSIERYREVMAAYVRGAARSRTGAAPASVASFFVSRLDTLLDPVLEKHPDPRAKDLLSRLAIDNARLAYAAWEAAGSPDQRPLWASTSTKNPRLRDVLYLEALAGPRTVDTVPYETLAAFRDHGEARDRIREDQGGARARMATLAELGIDLAERTRFLEEDGIKKFSDSYAEVLGAIKAKRGR